MDIVTHVGKEKARAMDERDLGNWDGAFQILEAARRQLAAALAEQEARTQTRGDELRDFERAIKKQLYHLLGSVGGVYRRRAASDQRQPGDLRSAVENYDAGYRLEREFTDSYNLTQRLVTRVLLQPEAALDEGAEVLDERLRAALREARTIIDSQTANNGPRANDEYAWADLLLIVSILGNDDWRHEVKTAVAKVPAASYANDATVDVLRELLGAVRAAGSGAETLRARLESVVGLLGG